MTQPPIKTFTLPNHPGETITVPRRLGGKRKQLIHSAGNPNEITGFNEQNQPMFKATFDPNAMAWETLIQCLTHQDASWNLKDSSGRPLRRDRTTIEESGEYEDDFIALSVEIYGYVFAGEDASDEGNADAASKPHGDEASSSTSTAPAHKARATRR